MTPDDPLPPGYPTELWEVAYLEDGAELVLRPILPSDDVRLERLFERCSPETIYRRFFATVKRLDRKSLEYLTHLDYVDRMAIVAVVDDEVIGVARYDRTPGLTAADEAETAIMVEDAWQRHGIATRLLWRLASAARARGVVWFIADVLAQNRPMMGLLQVMAEELHVELAGSEYRVRMRIASLRPPA